MRGVVKLFNKPRGYGFIIPETGGADVRFHVVDVGDVPTRRSLNVGSEVTFDVQHGEKGAYAVRLRIEVPFTWVDLPEGCSHRVAVRCDKDGTVAVFQNRGDATEWINAKREDLRQCSTASAH